MFLCAAVLLGCISGGQQGGNSTGDNNSGNQSGIVPAKPLIDSAVIRARVLSIQDQNAQLEVLEVVSYKADPRDGSIKVKSDDVKDFTFQWGTAETNVSLPSGSLHLAGIRVNDTILANATVSSMQWRVYEYEKVG